MAMVVAVETQHMAKRMIAGVVVAEANTKAAQMIAGAALDVAGLMKEMDPRHRPKMLHGSESLSYLPCK
jgi:hypothetical protein